MNELINEPAEDTSEADYYELLDGADWKREDKLNELNDKLPNNEKDIQNKNHS